MNIKEIQKLITKEMEFPVEYKIAKELHKYKVTSAQLQGMKNDLKLPDTWTIPVINSLRDLERI